MQRGDPIAPPDIHRYALLYQGLKGLYVFIPGGVQQTKIVKTSGDKIRAANYRSHRRHATWDQLIPHVAPSHSYPFAVLLKIPPRHPKALSAHRYCCPDVPQAPPSCPGLSNANSPAGDRRASEMPSFFNDSATP